MQRTTIMQRLVLLTAVPLIALIIVCAMQIWQGMSSYRDAEQTQNLMNLSISIGNLAHTLQIERGATAGFVQSKGQRFADILPEARQKTNNNLQAFKNQAAQLDSPHFPALSKAISAAHSKLDLLNDLRQKASQQTIPAAETTAYYTSTIAQLVEAIGASVAYNKDAAISQRLIAYIGFVRAKENAGQERALTTAVYAANKAEPAQLRAILERISRQEAHLADFRSVAGAEEQSSLEAALAGAPAQDVLRMRNILIEKAPDGGFDIDPTVWFKSITAKIDAMHETEQLITQNIMTAAEHLHHTSRTTLLTFITLGGVALAVTLSVSLWVARSISTPLRNAVLFAEKTISENDFTQTMPEAGTREVARNALAFNRLTQKFHEIIAHTKTSSEQIASAAKTMEDASREVSQTAAIQTHATAAVVSAVEEISSSINESASNAQLAAAAVAQARNGSEAAQQVMKETIAQTNNIASILHNSSSNIEQLDDHSRKIGGIVQVIKEIADQTNLLALNAAIEAARAGEQGRGFAVVADEVRKLAERTALATGEVATLITSIQSVTSDIVIAMQEANTQAETNLELVEHTETALQNINKDSQAVASHVNRISHALTEQNTAIHQIATSIEEIAKMTESNNRAADSSNHIATDLNQLSTKLRSAVSAFKI